MALTLYRLVPHDQALTDVQENAVVEVTETHPGEPNVDQVLYELHPLSNLIEATDQEGIYRIRWSDALDWPHQITAP